MKTIKHWFYLLRTTKVERQAIEHWVTLPMEDRDFISAWRGGWETDLPIIDFNFPGKIKWGPMTITQKVVSIGS